MPDDSAALPERQEASKEACWPQRDQALLEAATGDSIYPVDIQGRNRMHAWHILFIITLFISQRQPLLYGFAFLVGLVVYHVLELGLAYPCHRLFLSMSLVLLLFRKRLQRTNRVTGKEVVVRGEPTPSSHPLQASAADDAPDHGGLRSCPCATEFDFGEQVAQEITLHITGEGPGWICRLKALPGSTITVSIDWESFRPYMRDRGDEARLKHSLQQTLDDINKFNLRGLRFQYIQGPARGIITLEYGGNRICGAGHVTWASAEFPRPGALRYTVKVYSASFHPRYRDSLVNILSHEFAHLMGMRHSDAQLLEKHIPSVQYPPGDPDHNSIMGRFTHPGQLFFHENDINWLQKLYAQKEGDEIQGRVIKDAMPVYPPGRGTTTYNGWVWRLRML